MNLSQGDIVIIPFPFSNLSNSKPRPAIVISNKLVNETSDVILAQISSIVRNDKFSFVLKNTDLTTSLKTDSEIRCNKFFTAEKSIIQKKISSLKASKHQELFKKITSLLEPS
jgi:mRNA interferase MazF